MTCADRPSTNKYDMILMIYTLGMCIIYLLLLLSNVRPIYKQ